MYTYRYTFVNIYRVEYMQYMSTMLGLVLKWWMRIHITCNIWENGKREGLGCLGLEMRNEVNFTGS